MKITNSIKEKMMPKMKKNKITKLDSDSVNKIQVSVTDSSSTIGEDHVVWENLLALLESSDKGETSDSNDTE